jgi:hypothetical protein
MSDALGTYLHDHLTGAAHAIDLLEYMRDRHQHEELGQFASELLVEITEDRDTLRQVAERAGVSGTTIKELAGRLSDKVSRIKLKFDDDNSLGTFEALEFLSLGIHGKLALWRALATAAPSSRRLTGTNFERLAARAQQQHDRVDQRRLAMASRTLGFEAGARQSAEKNASRGRARGPAGSAQRSEFRDLQYGRDSKACNDARGGLAMRRNTIIGSIVITLGLVVAVAMLPDLVRYMKIRSM